MTATYETSETHLLLNGPGLFELGKPWNETVKVDEGQTRRRKLPSDGVWEPPVFGEPEPVPAGPKVERKMYIGVQKMRISVKNEETE